MKRILLIWGNWGPYHYARFRALHDLARKHGIEAHGLELYASSGVYEWDRPGDHERVHHFQLGERESSFHPVRMLREIAPFIRRLRPDVVFVPSYWHWSCFVNVLSRMTGARIVMMNESHGGTQAPQKWKRFLKRMIVQTFHAGLVGGSPHRRHFANLGLDESTLYSGYDAVDNEYFTERSREVRENSSAYRERLGLPEHYFLSLGRMVAKKNLETLVRAYALFRKQHPAAPHEMVFVGSGEMEERLRGLCKRLALPVIDHVREEVGAPTHERAMAAAGGVGENGSRWNKPPAAVHEPSVHFYGFRQIDENPIFYALACSFVLPSLMEEWGLVVNEAMACSLPVIVSRNAGCAEDLVDHQRNGFTFDPESHEDLAAALAKTTHLSTSSLMGARSRQIAGEWGCDRFASSALQAAGAAAGEPFDNHSTQS